MVSVKKIGITAIVSGLIPFISILYPEEVKNIINNIVSQAFGVSPSIVGYLIVAGVFAVVCAFFSGWVIWEGLTRIPFGQRFRDRTKEFFHAKADWGALDPKFGHLTIHNASKKDTPCTKNPAFGRYVSNNKTMQAYFISTFVDINRKAMNFHTHDGADAVLQYLRESGYTINPKDPTLEDLGLIT